jgi:hypothetical protein
VQLASKHLVIMVGRPLTLQSPVVAALAHEVRTSPKHMVTGQLDEGPWVALHTKSENEDPERLQNLAGPTEPPPCQLGCPQVSEHT